MRVYQEKNVLDSMPDRLSKIFDNHKRVIVSISSGKDSTLLAHLAQQEAVRRGREIEFFFLDQEAEYNATVEQIRTMMSWQNVKPLWYQSPIKMTNACSYNDIHLNAWHEGEEWIRSKEPNSITADNAPDRFYPFFRWFEEQNKGSASLIGLRAEEVMRYRAVTQYAAIAGIPWSSKGHGDVIKYYPVYDWTFEDVWKYFHDFNVPYNRLYDWMHMKGKRIPDFRVSNLIHENAFQCLDVLQECEPDTYNSLCKRLGGVSVAARYARESSVYQTHKKPKAFKTWSEYRDFLLTTIPIEIADTFRRRFAKQLTSESVHRQQVRQIVTNDWENSRPVKRREDNDPLEKWRAIL